MIYLLLGLMIVVLFYPKTNILKVVWEHLKTLYNAKKYKISDNKKIYFLDILFFFIMPLIVSYLIVYVIEFEVFSFSIFITIYIVFIPVFFVMLTLINSWVLATNNLQYKLFAHEVFYNTAFCLMLSILGLITVYIHQYIIVSDIFSAFLIYIFIIFLLSLMLVVKRVLAVLNLSITESKKENK